MPHIPTAKDENRSGITDLWPHKQIILFPDILSTPAASSEENHEACCSLFHLIQHHVNNLNLKENIPGKDFSALELPSLRN